MTVQAEGRRAGAHHPRRRAADVGRLDAVGALFSQSRGKVAFDDATKRFLPGTYAQDCVSVGACNGTDGLAETIAEALAAGEKAAKEAGGKAGKGTKLKAETSRELGRRHGRRGARRRRRTRRSRPSSISRTTSPPRTSGWRCAKACARSSTSSASPPTAWRPTRARPRTCTAWPSPPRRWARTFRQVGLTTFRAPYTPVTFGAIVNHGARRAVRPDAQDGDPSLGRGQWRGVRGCRPVEARLVFPEARRGHACRGQPRMRDRAQDAPACSTPRRSARSRWSGRTPPNSWSCSTPTRGRSWSPAAAAMASCCAKTASSMTTAWSAGWRRTASM